MSRRLLKADAVVLKTARFGEMHKRVTLLTDTEGILYVNAYGAAKGKGKLSGLVLPFSYLQANLYYDPVKQGYKLTDAHPIRLHEGIHGSLKKYYAASAVAEILLKSFGGGESAPFFTAATEVLENIEKARGEMVVYALIQFLWRFIIISGFAPDLQECAGCGRPHIGVSQVGNSPALGPGAKGPAVYIDILNHEAYCSSCGGSRMAALNRGAVHYLKRSRDMPFQAACRVTLDRKTERQVFLFLKDYIEAIIEGPVASLPLWEEQL